MNENNRCPKCGATIAPEWKHELCPACLMNAGFATGTQGDAVISARANQQTIEGIRPADGGQEARLTVEEVRKLFPQLEIIEQIGKGGMGVVYKARQPQLDRMVALKLLPADLAKTPGFSDRFSREARALAKLNHPNIVSVFDFGNADGHFFFIMEFVDGANLRQMIASKQITPDAALGIVPKVCEALQFAHDEGIFHRDIKPENILIDKKGRVKIADFGLAKLVDDRTVDHSLTGTHQVMGTPRYMAPEQFENTKSVDHRADIYSLGVVFYEMLTGEIPMGRFAVPSKKVQVDVRIDEVVLKSLEREPSQRYQHVSEVKSDVENVTHAGHGAIPVPIVARKVETKEGEGSAVSPTLPAVAPELRTKINAAGILMVIAGIAVSLSGFIAFIYGAVMSFKFANQTGNTGDAATRAAGGAFEMLLITLIGLAVFVSGLSMRKFRYRSFALASSVLLLALPLVLLATFGLSQLEWVFFQLIFGVYVGFSTFTLLRKPEVEAAFESASEVPMVGNSGDANFQSSQKPMDHRVSEVVTKGIPGWFNARAKWVQSLVQGVLMVVWVIGLFAFLSFSFKASSGSGTSEKVIAFGMPAPWLEIVHGTMNFQWMIHPFAPSVVLALLGAVAAYIYEKIRRSRPGFDAAKDRRSTRRWLIAMGVVFAAIITAAAMLLALKPSAAMPMRRAVITEDASANEGAASKVHRMFRYNVNAPADHRASFWVEYWRDGKLDKKVGLTGGQMRQLPSRAAFEGGFDFSFADGSKTSPDAAGKVRWDFFVSSRLRDWVSSNGVMKVNNDAGRGGHGDWIADPFAGLDVVSSWGKTRKWNVVIGEPVTVLVLRGYATGENLALGLNPEEAKQGKACILVRARFDAVPENERVEHSQAKTLDAVAVEKLNMRDQRSEAAGVEKT